MQRRSFLAGVLAAGAAPAIVKADSIMKLWVPRKPPWYIPYGLLPKDEHVYLEMIPYRHDWVLAELDSNTGRVLRRFQGAALLDCQDSSDLERGILRVPPEIPHGVSLQFSFDYKAADWKPDTGAISATA